jgi:hypothetical protein
MWHGFPVFREGGFSIYAGVIRSTLNGEALVSVISRGPREPSRFGWVTAVLSASALPLFGINTTSNSRVVTFAGGIPIQRDGDVVGAVGVSGGTPDQDQQVAEAGAAAF